MAVSKAVEHPSKKEVGPQPGPQTIFLKTSADIAIYGGAAGGGKTFALLLEALRNVSNKKFGTVIFRRNTTHIRANGGLWDESMKLYPLVGGIPKEVSMKWEFPGGSKITFSHLEYEKNVHDWQGSQIPLICFDELTHFTYKQFFYLLSRNRSTSGVAGYVRATTNPDPDSWVREFIDWWIGDDGFPIKERAGKLRWFIRVNDIILWADTKKECHDLGLAQGLPKDQVMPKSITFIPASIQDNKILLDVDPSYLANLNALPSVDRERLLAGNWDVRPQAGSYFKSHWFRVVDPNQLPMGRRVIRYWDRAATQASPGKDPDWTVGLKLSVYENTFYIEDIIRFRGRSAEVEKAIKNTKDLDGQYVTVGIEQDPGQSGKFEAEYYVRELAGSHVWLNKVDKSKEVRARPISSQVEHGNVCLVRGEWNKSFLLELEGFPDGGHDDQVDALSGAFTFFTSGDRAGTMSKLAQPSNKNKLSPSLKAGPLW